MGTSLTLLGAPALGLPLAETVRMTFPKGKASPWGIQELGGVRTDTPPDPPHLTWLHASETPA